MVSEKKSLKDFLAADIYPINRQQAAHSFYAPPQICRPRCSSLCATYSTNFTGLKCRNLVNMGLIQSIYFETEGILVNLEFVLSMFSYVVAQYVYIIVKRSKHVHTYCTYMCVFGGLVGMLMHGW
jgi:hypothetical protein